MPTQDRGQATLPFGPVGCFAHSVIDRNWSPRLSGDSGRYLPCDYPARMRSTPCGLNPSKRFLNDGCLSIFQPLRHMRPCTQIPLKLRARPRFLHPETSNLPGGPIRQRQTAIVLFNVPKSRKPEPPNRLAAIKLGDESIDWLVNLRQKVTNCREYPIWPDDSIDFPIKRFKIAEPVERLCHAHEVHTNRRQSGFRTVCS